MVCGSHGWDFVFGADFKLIAVEMLTCSESGGCQ